MKKELKKSKAKKQNGIGAISGAVLPDDTKLYDTHRKKPRMEGGGYDDENFLVDDPVTHAKQHGTWRERTEELAELKALLDDFRQIQKLRLKVANQFLAAERHMDQLKPETEAFLKATEEGVQDQEIQRGKALEQWVKAYKKTPLIAAILSVKGVGPMAVANLLVDIQIEKAEHPSSLWKYFGYDTASIDRYKKGQKGGGNKPGRCALYVLAGSFLKCAAPYSEIYYACKVKLEQSEKLVRERRRGDGKIVEVMWKDAMPIHRHLAAIRKMMKHYLADLWFVWRTLEGLPTTDLYVKEHLGHESAIINPKGMGWIF